MYAGNLRGVSWECFVSQNTTCLRNSFVCLAVCVLSNPRQIPGTRVFDILSWTLKMFGLLLTSLAVYLWQFFFPKYAFFSWSCVLRYNCLYTLMSSIKYAQKDLQWNSDVAVLNRISQVISQWAIFAIRNLLEHNTQNQEQVATLERRGTADYSALRELGFLVEERDGGLLLKTVRKDSWTSLRGAARREDAPDPHAGSHMWSMFRRE